MSSRGWWWQRLHPVLRGVLAVAYFGIAIAVIVVAVTPSLHSADPTNDTPASEPIATEPSVTEPPSDEQEAVGLTGADLYATNCSSCHGQSLEGGAGPALGVASDAAELSDNRIIVRITDGKNTMPAFGGLLTDEQIELIVEFIRESQAG